MKFNRMIISLLPLCWSIGISGHFLIEFFIKNNSIYQTNLFDMIFDVGFLFLLSLINIIIIIIQKN